MARSGEMKRSGLEYKTTPAKPDFTPPAPKDTSRPPNARPIPERMNITRAGGRPPSRSGPTTGIKPPKR